jgi:hypothetical protein
MHIRNIILFVFLVNISFAQPELSRLSQANRIFFVSEISGPTSNIVNPAGLAVRPDDDGALITYDFIDLNEQGNTFVSFSMGDLGISYQDIYRYDDIRIQSYSLNLSIGGEVLSIGTSNKIMSIGYSKSDRQFFNIDIGLLFRPAESINLSFVARNLGEPAADSLDFVRNYTFGAGISLFNEFLQLYTEIDFKEKTRVSNNLTGIAGIVLSPINFLELRLGVYKSPLKNYEGLLTFSFLIEKSFRLLASTRFNEEKERTRYSLMVVLPLQTVSF